MSNFFERNLSSLIKAGYDNPRIDNKILFKFFGHLHNESSFYKATGDFSLIQNEMQNQVVNNLEFKTFLEGFVDPKNLLTVYEIITKYLA